MHIKNFTKKITKKNVIKFLSDNKWCFLQLGIMMLPSVISFASTGSVSTGIDPLDTPLTKINSAMTGAVPKVGVTIAAAAGATSWALGTENQVTRYALRAAMGGGIAMSAPAAIQAITGTTVTGCLF